MIIKHGTPTPAKVVSLEDAPDWAKKKPKEDKKEEKDSKEKAETSKD